MSTKPNIKSAPGQCKLRVEETETRDAIVTDGHTLCGDRRTIAYVAIGAESWGPLLAASTDLREALAAFVTAAKSWHNFHHGSKGIQCDALCACIPAGEAALAKATS
jgi:hypothetical protein